MEEEQVTGNRILLTGSSGLIGASLVRALHRDRISFIALQRKKNLEEGLPEPEGPFWDPYASPPMTDPQTLSGITGAVHLSGANLAARRWDDAYKQELLQSRIQPTRALAVLLAGLRPRPEVMIVASAIGIYGDRGDETLTEVSPPGSGFLPEACIAWEKATQPAEDAGIRVVHVRFGVVLDEAGGALKQMLPIFKLGLGGRLGTGKQWMSWVALQDASRAILFALEAQDLRGAINLVSPQPVTNIEFTRTLGRVLHRPTLMPAPAAALRLAFGEMADAALLTSERVLPARLQAAGFAFEYSTLEEALHASIKKA